MLQSLAICHICIKYGNLFHVYSYLTITKLSQIIYTLQRRGSVLFLSNAIMHRQAPQKGNQKRLCFLKQRKALQKVNQQIKSLHTFPSLHVIREKDFFFCNVKGEDKHLNMASIAKRKDMELQEREKNFVQFSVDTQKR